MLTPQDELPLLPYSIDTLTENLKCALDDLDNIISIDGWEQEFFRHYERQFSKDGSSKQGENSRSERRASCL